MMQSADEYFSKIHILRYDGRQRLDFSARKKSFATTMSQKYGELAQVFRTGQTFVNTAPDTLHENIINEYTEADAMEMYM